MKLPRVTPLLLLLVPAFISLTASPASAERSMKRLLLEDCPQARRRAATLSAEEQRELSPYLAELLQLQGGAVDAVPEVYVPPRYVFGTRLGDRFSGVTDPAALVAGTSSGAFTTSSLQEQARSCAVEVLGDLPLVAQQLRPQLLRLAIDRTIATGMRDRVESLVLEYTGTSALASGAEVRELAPSLGVGGGLLLRAVTPHELYRAVPALISAAPVDAVREFVSDATVPLLAIAGSLTQVSDPGSQRAVVEFLLSGSPVDPSLVRAVVRGFSQYSPAAQSELVRRILDWRRSSEQRRKLSLCQIAARCTDSERELLQHLLARDDTELLLGDGAAFLAASVRELYGKKEPLPSDSALRLRIASLVPALVPDSGVVLARAIASGDARAVLLGIRGAPSSKPLTAEFRAAAATLAQRLDSRELPLSGLFAEEEHLTPVVTFLRRGLSERELLAVTLQLLDQAPISVLPLLLQSVLRSPEALYPADAAQLLPLRAARGIITPSVRTGTSVTTLVLSDLSSRSCEILLTAAASASAERSGRAKSRSSGGPSPELIPELPSSVVTQGPLLVGCVERFPDLLEVRSFRAVLRALALHTGTIQDTWRAFAGRLSDSGGEGAPRLALRVLSLLPASRRSVTELVALLHRARRERREIEELADLLTELVDSGISSEPLAGFAAECRAAVEDPRLPRELRLRFLSVLALPQFKAEQQGLFIPAFMALVRGGYLADARPIAESVLGVAGVSELLVSQFDDLPPVVASAVIRGLGAGASRTLLEAGVKSGDTALRCVASAAWLAGDSEVSAPDAALRQRALDTAQELECRTTVVRTLQENGVSLERRELIAESFTSPVIRLLLRR